MKTLFWLPWVLFAWILWMWYTTRHTKLAPARETEGFAESPFWERMKQIQIDDIRRLDRMLQEMQNDKDHPYKMTEYEEYFDTLGISK